MRYFLLIVAVTVSGCMSTGGGHSSSGSLRLAQASSAESTPIRSGPCPGFTAGITELEQIMAAEQALMSVMN
jgi:hypothetical protein